MPSGELNHTLEPWMVRVFPFNKKPYVVDTIPDVNGRVVCNVICGPTLNPNDDEDKARIVACVNALAGIEDPESELTRLRTIAAEYEALRAACKAIVALTYKDDGTRHVDQLYDPLCSAVEDLEPLLTKGGE